MGDAIAMTNRLYPGFLQLHPSLHFMLKVESDYKSIRIFPIIESCVLQLSDSAVELFYYTIVL